VLGHNPIAYWERGNGGSQAMPSLGSQTRLQWSAID
jgi:hypothetical protein